MHQNVPRKQPPCGDRLAGGMSEQFSDDVIRPWADCHQREELDDNEGELQGERKCNHIRRVSHPKCLVFESMWYCLSTRKHIIHSRRQFRAQSRGQQGVRV